MVILREILRWVSFILLYLIFIIILYFKYKFGVFSTPFIFIYSFYLLFLFFDNLLGTGLEKRLMERKLNENEKLMSLRMNHSLVLSIFFISVALGLVFEGLRNNYEYWYIFVFGIFVLIIGIVILSGGYFSRFKKLENYYLQNRIIT